MSEGLITPEQLAHIHAIGSEMDQVRPAIVAATAAANRAAQQAVETSREARDISTDQRPPATAAMARVRRANVRSRPGTSACTSSRRTSARACCCAARTTTSS